MANFVKLIDSNHLLGLGSEGFYGPSNASRISANPNTYVLQLGTDFLRNHQVDGIDFAGAHAYPDAW
jgi:mannan endo-1,4-beta-mannosidase